MALRTSLVEPAEGQNMKYKVHESLSDRLVPITELRQHPKNARNGDIDAIAASLALHGQYRPIVVNRGTYSDRYERNTIGGGNHTYAACLELGWTHVAVTWIDVEDVELDKILIVDNRTSDLAWNDEGLILSLLKEMPNIEGTGYDQLSFEELAEKQSQPLEFTGERKKTPEERLAVYETTSLRQIHLIMNETEYDWLMPRLGDLAEEYGLETNAEIFSRLVAEHFNEEAPVANTQS